MNHAVRARLSSVEVQLELAAAPLAAHTLGSVWSSTPAVEYVPTSAWLRAHAERVGDQFVVSGLPDGPRVLHDERLIAPTIERAMYDAFIDAELRAGRAVLHASGARKDGTTYVFAGLSGAGKSALARAALAAGFQYFSDEHLVADRNRLWGVPRAVHLDLEPYERAPAPWHSGADRESYVFEEPSGRRWRLPFVQVAPERVAPTPSDLSEVVLVALQRSHDNAVHPLGAAERLQLLDASHFVRGPALAALALAAEAYALHWREPEGALALLTQSRRARR